MERKLMANFVTVTRADIGTPQIVNLDTVETVDVSPPEPLPPLDDEKTPITSRNHLGYVTLHFSSGRTALIVEETADDFAAIAKTQGDPKAAKAAADKRAAAVAKIVADRAKARMEAKAKQLDEEHKAARKALDDAAAAQKAAAAPPPPPPDHPPQTGNPQNLQPLPGQL
jgi:hypothetical protein